MKFCPKCGKKGIQGVLCSECSIGQNFLEFREIRIKLCGDCKQYFFKGKWLGYTTIKNAIQKIVEKSMKARISADITPMLPEMVQNEGMNYDFEIEIKISPKEKYYLPAKIEFVRCPRCSKSGTTYYEGILQLRNPNKEVVDFIRKEIAGERERGVHITHEEDVAYGKGIDFYITSQRYLQTLGLKLQKRFGGILKVNPRIFSRDRQTSRDVYRVNVLFELLDFKVGDVVLSENKIIKISEIRKNAVGYDLKTGKKTNFEYKNRDYKVLDRKKSAVVKRYPHTEVLEPETYQNIKVGNEKNVKEGEDVEIVVVNGIAYVL